MKKRLNKGLKVIISSLLATTLLFPLNQLSINASESTNTEESSQSVSNESREIDTEIFKQFINEDTVNNQALLQALEDFVMLADTYHFQDMTASELEEVTATQEEIQADFNPDAESEVFEYENGESTLSYMYEVEDDVAFLEASFADGYLIHIDLVAVTMNVDEVNVVSFEEIEEVTSIDEFSELDFTTLGIGLMNIDGYKPTLAIPSTMPEDLPEGFEQETDTNDMFVESYILFEDNSIRYSTSEAVDSYLNQTVQGMVALLQAYMESL